MKLSKTIYPSRARVSMETNKIYIFTDNCDRTSGRGIISNDSSYSKRFNKTGLKYPKVSSAFIRGLENAFPVTTQKRYVSMGKNADKGNWTDDDFEDFKKVIDEDFEAIKEACKRIKPSVIYFPLNGILDGSISKITLVRTPKLYNYIVQKEIELRDLKV